ncbi:MAG: hypothetical protein C4538_11495 [Nitrospiraceae bacterium]|nr:MAG: hypothetical protein C4538_11495 [Nitrospiraceae bacterium]
MKLSEKTQKELVELANSEELRKDMEILNMRQRPPFISNGVIDVDAYIEFIQQFNEFINHEPRPFKAMIERDMKL